MQHAVLHPHPDGAPGPIQTIEVRLEREGSILWLRFEAIGDVERVLLPAAAPPERTDDLWKHTCFEAFVSTPDGYREYNLSPSSRWATYAFDGYRAGMRAAEETATVDPLDFASDQIALEARIALPTEGSKLALSAVIEDRDCGKTYWALAHPSPEPDFHNFASFVLDLP